MYEYFNCPLQDLVFKYQDLWRLAPLATIFQAVSFIGGGNWSTRRKPDASHWQKLLHNEQGSNSQL